MKNYIKKLVFPFLIVSIILGITSCKKYLDKSPLADIDETQAFESYRNFQGFVEELYNCVPLVTAIGSHNNWNFGEDELWEMGDNRLFAYNVDHGDYWAWNTAIFGSWFKTGGNPTSNNRGDKGNLWGLSWYGIRKANIGLANLDLLLEATPEEKKLIEGQLYFFRGWFHFMLMQYWGGLPYIDVALSPAEPPRVQRLNYQETAEKVAEDLRKAADLLPVDWDQIAAGAATRGNNDRRANKIMALTFLGKNLLYAGSPLMNEESTGSRTYNADFCKRAAEAFGEALQICESTGRYSLIPFEHYSKIFYTFAQNGAIPGAISVQEGGTEKRYREAIMLENHAESNGRFRWNQSTDYRPYTIIARGIKAYPTANYVDNYGMANGLPINMTNPSQPDAESGYDPNFPWKDRDPRFYHDIMIDGEKVVNNGSYVGNDHRRQYASLHTQGLFRTDPGNTHRAPITGYMLAKYISRLSNDWEGYMDNNVMYLSFMRLADVYLMYAEAASEGYNSPTGKSSNYNKTAVDAVNIIRDRPGLNVGHVAPKFLASQDAFRSEYRRERAVELSFEGHRFNDLRRWLLLTEKPYVYKMGIHFDRGMPDDQVYADPKNARVLNYRQYTIFERKYEKRHYWFPFIVSDVNIYEGFSQNPGW